jgi:hypothetical protein
MKYYSPCRQDILLEFDMVTNGHFEFDILAIYVLVVQKRYHEEEDGQYLVHVSDFDFCPFRSRRALHSFFPVDFWRFAEKDASNCTKCIIHNGSLGLRSRLLLTQK